MKLILTHKGNRNQLTCYRKDSSTTTTNINSTTPYHDLAHFVVESELKLKSGFYGNIENGYSIEELSRKEIIQILPQESMVAEIITRALQSLWSGACDLEQFIPLIKSELNTLNINYPLNITNETVESILSEYQKLIEHWNLVKEGESLELVFEI